MPAGTVTDVLYGGNCRTYSIKGYVQVEEPATAASTQFILSIPGGAVRDCAGRPFPAASLLSTYDTRRA